MAIYYSTDDLPAFNNAALTIGTFDGVHMGHQVILKEVVNHAKENNGESILLTFEPHPRKLLFPDQRIEIITPLDKKLELINAIGIKHIVVVPFTHEFAKMSAREYVSDFLVKEFQPQSIVIGYDHHFGNDRKGNIALLNEMKREFGFNVVEISAQLIDNATVSSTKVRKALKEGQVSEAEQMLGRSYSLLGNVKQGAQLGRTIGYPTANIQPLHNEQIIPANGVYAVKVVYNNSEYTGMLNIGFKPTVANDSKLSIEVNIFNFSDDIYGRELEIIFIERLRQEQKFSSIDELKEQLKKDELQAKKILG